MTSVFTLGIDVGGTNTDAALFDAVSQSVISSAKTRTLHCDYKKSIDKVLSILLENNKNICENILSCNVSTTLSTNAILEHKGSTVNMVLIVKKLRRCISIIWELRLMMKIEKPWKNMVRT